MIDTMPEPLIPTDQPVQEMLASVGKLLAAFVAGIAAIFGLGAAHGRYVDKHKKEELGPINRSVKELRDEVRRTNDIQDRSLEQTKIAADMLHRTAVKVEVLEVKVVKIEASVEKIEESQRTLIEKQARITGHLKL